jgi:hypothetical protein
MKNTIEESYQNNLKPYEGGRELNETDLIVLKHLVDAKFAICDIIKTMEDMPQIERTQRTLNDLQIIIHIWKKKDGTI